MATLCFAFCNVLIQIDPKPNSSKELFKVIDSSKVLSLKVASTPESLEIPKKVESYIYFFSNYVGTNIYGRSNLTKESTLKLTCP